MPTPGAVGPLPAYVFLAILVSTMQLGLLFQLSCNLATRCRRYCNWAWAGSVPCVEIRLNISPNRSQLSVDPCLESECSFILQSSRICPVRPFRLSRLVVKVLSSDILLQPDSGELEVSTDKTVRHVSRGVNLSLSFLITFLTYHPRFLRIHTLIARLRSRRYQLSLTEVVICG